ncbi:50S ribosomal protein L23 [Patescibacteria group bacterium]|nr:50S ribosomal protein L23 [Patescibacteria group bacterium]MBU4162465.1 50S ribosomal protein L23 [Patescibacteria group bacterium]
MSIFDVFKKKVRPEIKKEQKKEMPVVEKAVKKPEVKVVVKKEKKEKKEIVKEIKEAKKKGATKKQGILAPDEKTEEKKIVKPKKAVKPTSLAWKVLVKPHVTEKATYLGEKNEYAFVVSKSANKIEVKKAIEDVYDVNVEKVRMINIPGKKRRLGRVKGFKSGYKKAIIKIKKGQEIEVLPR